MGGGVPIFTGSPKFYDTGANKNVVARHIYIQRYSSSYMPAFWILVRHSIWWTMAIYYRAPLLCYPPIIQLVLFTETIN